MVKQTAPPKTLVELKDLSADAAQQMTIRVSPALHARIVESASLSGNQLSRESTSNLSEHFTNVDHGVTFSLEPETRRRLDVVGEILGTDRNQIVRILILDGLSRMLQKAIDQKAESDELVRKLDALDAAAKKQR